MDNELRSMIAEVLGVPVETIDANTSTQTQPRWDSLRHMNLVFALEDHYRVRFSDEEIPALTSVAAIEAALGSHA